MKHVLMPLLMGAMISCAHSVAQKLEFDEKVNREFTVAGPAGAGTGTLVIYNINGFVHVEGTTASNVTFDVDKRLTAQSEEGLEEGKNEFRLVMEQVGDTVFAYITNPFDSRPSRENRSWDGKKINYDFTLDFTVKIPRQMNVRVSTINRGDVAIRDVAGNLRVRNVNGAISLANPSGVTDAHTINGNVEATYSELPADASSYYTLNGDIKVSCPASLSADLLFKSFQGDLYTDFSQTETLPKQVIRNKEKNGDKTVYKLDKITSVRIGNGGKKLRFETFNGNVYLKKSS